MHGDYVCNMLDFFPSVAPGLTYLPGGEDTKVSLGAEVPMWYIHTLGWEGIGFAPRVLHKLFYPIKGNKMSPDEIKNQKKFDSQY
jgi:hypothetical protein